MGLDIRELLLSSNKTQSGGFYKSRSVYIPYDNHKTPTVDEMSNDWIADISDEFIRHIRIGNLCICTIPESSTWTKHVEHTERNIFLHTGYKEWIWLIERNPFRIEIDNQLKTVWIGNTCSFKDVLKNTCLKHILSTIGFDILNSNKCAQSSLTIYARCHDSMEVLDDIHREYIQNKTFSKNEIVAIQSVAGSGKTTTLLNIAKHQPNKQILYVAFNKSLITEVRNKIQNQKISNLVPMTFDALMYRLFTAVKGPVNDITDLKPFSIGKHIPFLLNKPFKVKKFYCDQLRKFCNNIDYDDVNEYCEQILGQKKPLLEQLWKKCTDGSLNTFDGIRKQAFIHRWCLSYIDTHFDMIMIDETQDFDMVMLKMFLNDTTIPKLFVGDPKQSIYQFRGCVNAFEHLPPESKIIEFYSTFRVGNPACREISKQIPDCWMISKSKSQTHIVNQFKTHVTPYTFLARTWRVIFNEAMKTPNVWIYGFDKKKSEIISLHKKLQTITNFVADDEIDDDLPKFLKSLTFKELDHLIESIETNSVQMEEALVKMYTIHSFKGMEDENVRLANDVSMEQSENLYYVAITRGMSEIILDKVNTSQTNNNQQQSNISKYFSNPKTTNPSNNNQIHEKSPQLAFNTLDNSSDLEIAELELNKNGQSILTIIDQFKMYN